MTDRDMSLKGVVYTTYHSREEPPQQQNSSLGKGKLIHREIKLIFEAAQIWVKPERIAHITQRAS